MSPTIAFAKEASKLTSYFYEVEIVFMTYQRWLNMIIQGQTTKNTGILLRPSILISGTKKETLCNTCQIEKHLYNWSCGVVVITSALHAEGPQFDPGRDQLYVLTTFFFYIKFPSSRIWTSDLWMSDTATTTVHRSTNWAIEGSVRSSSKFYYLHFS